MSTLIEVKDLKKYFHLRGSLGQTRIVRSVDGVSFRIEKGETFGLVGESGCGKTTLGRTITRLYEPTSGQILFEGTDIAPLSGRSLSKYKRRMQTIFQDPYSSLNPFMNVEEIIGESLDLSRKLKGAERREIIEEILEKVGMTKEDLEKYPHEFSGGQRQRIGIARAIALSPELLILDEPVSALDVSVQSQILNLLKKLKKELALTSLFIGHDLSVIHFIADRVCVMFLGTLCEIAPKEELYKRPLHPYTEYLLDAIPKADPHLRGDHKKLLEGEIPSPVNLPSGCRFHTRCPYADDRCRTEQPALRDLGGGHLAACHRTADVT